MTYPWLRISIDAWFLGIEICNVVALRTLKLALGGPRTEAETRRMVEEKLEAFATLQYLFLTGGLGATPATIAHRSLSHYRKAVKQNRRRLTKRPK